MLAQGPAAPSSDCEWIGPRVDGISVQICAGEVRAYRDQSGNVRNREGL